MKAAIYTASIKNESTIPAEGSVACIDEEMVTLLKQQLSREISCLEGQLYRLKTRVDGLDLATLQTYEDMLDTRRRQLEML